MYGAHDFHAVVTWSVGEELLRAHHKAVNKTPEQHY